MNSRLQKQLEGLSARVARLQEDFGVVRRGFGVVEKDAEEEGEILQKRDIRFAKGTGTNSPRIASIDDKRDEIAELLATAVASGRAQVRSALMRDPEYLDLMRALEKDPQVRAVLMESLGAAERTAGGPQEEELQEPIGEYDHQAFAEAKERARRQQLGREAIRKGEAQQVFGAAQRLADKHANAGAKADLAPVTDHAIQKSATDTTRVDVRDLGKPRRMNQSEVLR